MDLPIIRTPVVYFEMTENPHLHDGVLDDYIFLRDENPDVDQYLNLYREVGRDYIWNYRPGQTREEIETIIKLPTTQLYILKHNNTAVGMGECDATDPKNIEIVHFGLLPRYLNQGVGRQFFQKLLYVLWLHNPDRVWLSTCGLDHPKAIAFYKNAGFAVFKTKEAEFKDYRYSDFYNKNDAPDIPHGQQFVDRQKYAKA